MPDTWQVIVLRSPEKTLAKLPKDLRERLRQAIDYLATDPRPRGCKKLTGYARLYRVRVGDWRIVYSIEDDRLVVLVLEVGPRGSVYRGL